VPSPYSEGPTIGKVHSCTELKRLWSRQEPDLPSGLGVTTYQAIEGRSRFAPGIKTEPEAQTQENPNPKPKKLNPEA
jgi:hypothetical protein